MDYDWLLMEGRLWKIDRLEKESKVCGTWVMFHAFHGGKVVQDGQSRNNTEERFTRVVWLSMEGRL